MQQQARISESCKVYTPFLESIPDGFDSLGCEIYRGRNTLRTFPSPDGLSEWVAKRYKRPNIFQRMAYRLTGLSKAKKAFICAENILKKGFLTPEPIASIDITKHKGLWQCYFVSDMSPMVRVADLIDKSEMLPDGMCEELAGYIAMLHDARIVHGDLNLSNILHNPEGKSKARFVLIDTNRSTFPSRALSRRMCETNLVRLTHNRTLLRAIVTEYAIRRGWDAERTWRAVERRLTRFERWRSFRHFFKRLFKITPRKN